MILIYAFVAFIAQRFVPYLGFFPYKELLVEYNLPTWISSFANFDGIHYLLIAKQNYSQWEQAFFPLFPLLIHFIFFIVPNYLVAALLLSNGTFIVGLLFFKKLLHMWGIKNSLPLFYLLAFPTAFFFGAVYTESLFFMLIVLSLYFLYKKNYYLAGLFAGLSSATRLIGVFLMIPFLFHFLEIKKRKISFNWVILSPLIGLFTYMTYLFFTTGDPLFFFNSQPIFGANRSTHLITLPQVYFRYFKILFLAAHDFQWYLSLFEMAIFTLVFAVLILELYKSIKRLQMASGHPRGGQRLGMVLFSLVNIVLPTLTGTFSSVPRYVLFSLSFFIVLGEVKNPILRASIFIFFIVSQIVLLSFFVQGYFIG